MIEQSRKFFITLKAHQSSAPRCHQDMEIAQHTNHGSRFYKSTPPTTPPWSRQPFTGASSWVTNGGNVVAKSLPASEGTDRKPRMRHAVSWPNRFDLFPVANLAASARTPPAGESAQGGKLKSTSTRPISVRHRPHRRRRRTVQCAHQMVAVDRSAVNGYLLLAVNSVPDEKI